AELANIGPLSAGLSLSRKIAAVRKSSKTNTIMASLRIEIDKSDSQ
ncbi:MAG: hypothetical protein ACJA2D_000789, partial [Pseudohongiellaceae bacterium]